jgi:hypothetical protein
LSADSSPERSAQRRRIQEIGIKMFKEKISGENILEKYHQLDKTTYFQHFFTMQQKLIGEDLFLERTFQIKDKLISNFLTAHCLQNTEPKL